MHLIFICNQMKNAEQIHNFQMSPMFCIFNTLRFGRQLIKLIEGSIFESFYLFLDHLENWATNLQNGKPLIIFEIMTDAISLLVSF